MSLINRIPVSRISSRFAHRAFSSSTLYTARSHTVGGRNGESKSDDGALSVKLSTPKSMGGPGGAGTNPEQLFASGYSACFLGAMGLVAKNAKTQLPANTAIDAKVDLLKGDDGLKIAVEFDITAPGWDKKQTEEIVRKAHEVCPYSRATKGNVDVKFNVK